MLTPLLETRGLTKCYGSLRANDDVSFSIFPGEIVGIVGENGAGKSTLGKILAGAVMRDGGDILIDGLSVKLDSPEAAQKAGISLVYQHFNLFENLTIEENLVLGRPELRRGLLDFAKRRPAFRRIAERLGTKLEFSAPVSSLSVGGRQQVELVKALFKEPRLLILDEPTAVLPPDERAHLLRFIRDLKARGVTTILISHKLDDLYECCDRAVVMRAGRVVGSCDLRRADRGELVRLIVGAELPPADTRRGAQGAPIVSVKNLVVRRDDNTIAVECGSFDLCAGEIVGLCGVEGNGQTELVQAIAGMRQIASGEITYTIGTRRLANRDAAMLRRIGVAHIPEDRLHHAVVSAFGLTQNWLLRQINKRRFAVLGFLRLRSAAAATSDAIKRNDVRAGGPSTRMAALSGGNQQKFVIARELTDDVTVILAGHPTRGLDIRTVSAIRNRLVAERARGVAILLLSADLSEIWDIADRIMVMTQGRLRGPVPVGATSLAEIGHWMTTP